MTAALAFRRPRPPTAVVPVVVLAYVLATVLAATPTRTTTYAGGGAAARVGDLAAGLGLIAAGLLAWGEPRARRLGALILLAGVVWYAPDWEGWVGGPSVVRSLGATAAPFLAPLVLHIVLCVPSGRLGSWGRRAVAAGGYAAAGCAAAGLALFRDPLYDLSCWRNCTQNAFLVHRDPALARALADFWLRASLVIAAAIVAAALVRLARASTPGRRGLWPALAPAAVAGGALVAYAIALHHNRAESPSVDSFAWLYLLRAYALAAFAAGLGWSVTRVARTRAAVTRLARELGDSPPPGTLRDALGTALGDGRLEVVYPLSDGRFVDGRGRPTEPPSIDRGRAVTPIARAGQPVALVGHDVALLEGSALERELGAAVRLAVENERLQAEVLAQLGDLRTSRARIVASGDAARRRLERDLHDGAQQRLLALSYDLRVARAAAAGEGADDLVLALDAASAQVQMALGELRELAQGIYPVALADSGLALALASVADSAPLPLDLGDVTSERFDTAVETAAYVTVVEGLADAVARGASYLAGSVTRDGGRLVVALHDDGGARASPLVHPADRIGALGGSLELGPASLRAEIPCA